MAGADTSCSVRPEGGKGDDVLETVARIGGRLASEEGGGGEAVVVESSLRELQGVRMTFEALEATKIGRAVNALRKSAPSEQARRLAAALYSGWKALADERLRSSMAQQQPPKADKGGIKKRSSSSSSPPPAVDAKQQSVEHKGGNREMAPTSVVVKATPETELYIHEGFGRAAIVKKPSSLPVVKVKVNTNAPPGKAAEQRRVTVVRRTPATPKPEPASNTTRRNDGGSKFNQQASCPATASHQGTNAAAKRVSPAGAAPLTTAKPPTAPPKPVGSSGACKRKAEASTVFDEARLARAKVRLHEGYKEASAAKEKRKIKEINVSEVLGKKARQPPARHVRCTAAHRTGKQAPVPCPAMPRAF